MQSGISACMVYIIIILILYTCSTREIYVSDKLSIAVAIAKCFTYVQAAPNAGRYTWFAIIATVGR